MRHLDLSPEAAIELWSTWDARGKKPWRSQTFGPDGEKLLVFEHANVRPLVVEQSLSARHLSVQVAWRVAFDAITLRIRMRSQLAAFLRPIEVGEADELLHDELLSCDGRNFAEHRDAAIDDILVGVRKRVILQRDNMLLAILTPLPSPGTEPLSSAAQTEIEILRHLRASRMSPEELYMLLGVWEQQQRRRGASIDSAQELPVVRIITQGEDAMLCELRRMSVHSREQLWAIVAATEVPTEPSCDNDIF